MWQDYKDKMGVDCDKLQRIHALENLATLLKESPEHACREFLPEDTAAEPEADPEADPDAPQPEKVDSKIDPDTLFSLKSQELLEEVSLPASLWILVDGSVLIVRQLSFGQSTAGNTITTCKQPWRHLQLPRMQFTGR